MFVTKQNLCECRIFTAHVSYLETKYIEYKFCKLVSCLTIQKRPPNYIISGWENKIEANKKETKQHLEQVLKRFHRPKNESKTYKMEQAMAAMQF